MAQFDYRTSLQNAIGGQPHGGIEPLSRPMAVPRRPQITQGVIANSEAGTWTHTVTNSQNGLVYTLTTTVSGATEATTLDELVAAWRAHAKLNALFTIAEDGVDTWTVTTRGRDIAFTITSTPPGSMTDTITTTQTSGGTGPQVGTFLAYGSEELQADELAATSTISDLAGFLFRTDANHFHSLEETLSDEDRAIRGRTYAIAHWGMFWVQSEDALARGGSVYVRRALTSGSGTLGYVRGTPAGSAQTSTWTPVADQAQYGIEFGYLGNHYEVTLIPTDGTTTVANAIDFMVLAIAAQIGAPSGLTFTDNTTNLQIITAAGTELDYLRPGPIAADGATPTAAVSLGTADVDTIDVSDRVFVERGVTAAGLVLIRLKGTF